MFLSDLKVCVKKADFTSKGTNLPLAFFPEARREDKQINVTVHVHKRGWDVPQYTKTRTAEYSRQQQQIQAGPSSSSCSSCSKITAICTPSTPSKACSCTLLGPFAAVLTATGKTSGSLRVNIQHYGQLLGCRPMQPNHTLVVLIKVSCSLFIGLNTCYSLSCVFSSITCLFAVLQDGADSMQLHVVPKEEQLPTGVAGLAQAGSGVSGLQVFPSSCPERVMVRRQDALLQANICWYTNSYQAY